MLADHSLQQSMYGKQLMTLSVWQCRHSMQLLEELLLQLLI